jgi:hypothetical protein
MRQAFVDKIAKCALLALTAGTCMPVLAQISEANRVWQEQQTMMQNAFYRGDRLAGCQHLNLAIGYLTLWYNELSLTNQKIDSYAESYRRVAVAENIRSQFPTSTNVLMNVWTERAAAGIKGKVSLEESVRLATNAKQTQMKLDSSYHALQLVYSQTWEKHCQ